MRKIFFVAALLFSIVSVYPQYNIIRYEFPEYGIDLPFFKEAKKTIENKGKPNEVIIYSYSKELKKSKTKGYLKVFTKIGCQYSDTVYNSLVGYMKAEGTNTDYYHINLMTQLTMPFGWFYFRASGWNQDKNTPVSREVQAFYNGEQLIILDLLFLKDWDNDFIKQMFDDPGYKSILRTLELKEIGLKLKVRGHVVSSYDKKSKKYYLGRCDKLGTDYPFVVFEKVEGDPGMLALSTMAEMRKETGWGNVDIETLPAEGKFAKFVGGVTKVTAKWDKDNTGRTMVYFFKFNGKTYKVSLVVKYGPNDNHMFYKDDREFSPKNVTDFDDRVKEMLENLDKM
ncbi:MAG: hypothetical protein LC102_04475 [Ignavibacteriales bacterium]|nr:MAG: hypothetical protein F9K26_10230 [Ignavibacteriaceae bacterium]MBW7874291.1 hypothetical protein [Ignavibacteria bacterium]MCZ2142665.1 hypothetical protein [Ignavibacteriales bacterium]OQY73478.1 MAG: hypothetical protein B6D45_08130 [Ignavibacteriales bacterium UTCHB3]MBV6443763.1 hypothetical protein [Ignavibacteriaceae bacterium]